jgi:hypothetical protein
MTEEIWDGEHRTDVEWRTKTLRRARCSCGWRARWRRGRTAGWNAGADADKHFNDET